MQVAVVGAGFSGCAVVWQLLRRLPVGRHGITIFNASGRMARGLAYGTRSAHHLLNVPAARMGIDPDAPLGFFEWLAGRGRSAAPASFVPRQWYGDYLSEALKEAIEARDDIRVEWVHGAVGAIERSDGRFVTGAAGSAPAVFDKVVLALGNFTPTPPHLGLASLPAQQFANDPWADAALASLTPDATVMLIGTGLTMMDVAASLKQQGHKGSIIALSRRGLTPQAHRDNELPPPAWNGVSEWPQGRTPLRWAMRAFRGELTRLASQNQDWRDAWVGLRAITPKLWTQLDMRERAQFVRHLQPYWDIHRHRAAPAAIRSLQSLVNTGQLQVHAGRVNDVVGQPDRVQVQWTPRGTTSQRIIEVARVINCSGPSSRITPTSSPLLWQMQQQGTLLACPLGLGVHVDEHCQLLDGQRQAIPGLYYLGPLLKAQYWEATAVPELRVHALSVARACSAS